MTNTTSAPSGYQPCHVFAPGDTTDNVLNACGTCGGDRRQPVPTHPRYIDAAATAKLVRSDLRAAFPGITFSVRSSRFSQGSAVDAHWTDGPTERQVEDVLCRFRGDIEIDGEAVRVLPEFVTGHRTLSSDFRALLVDDLSVALGESVEPDGWLAASVDGQGNIAGREDEELVSVLVYWLSQSTAVTAEREVVRAR